MQGLTGK